MVQGLMLNEMRLGFWGTEGPQETTLQHRDQADDHALPQADTGGVEPTLCQEVRYKVQGFNMRCGVGRQKLSWYHAHCGCAGTAVTCSSNVRMRGSSSAKAPSTIWTKCSC